MRLMPNADGHRHRRWAFVRRPQRNLPKPSTANSRRCQNKLRMFAHIVIARAGGRIESAAAKVKPGRPAIALQIMIWYTPFGYINSVTQYVLIALNKQRFLTWAFLIGVVFNVAANWLFIPVYGYRASAVIAVLSELVLLLSFYHGVRKHLAAVPWLQLIWRPVTSAVIMTVCLVLVWPLTPFGASILALIAYGAGLVGLRTFNTEDMMPVREAVFAVTGRLLGRFRRRAQP